MNITLLQEKHGQTPECPGCFRTHDQPRPRSRQRFEEIDGKERQQFAGGPAAADRSLATSEPAGGPTVQPTSDVDIDVEIGGSASASGIKRHGGEQQPAAVPKRTRQESKQATTETDGLRASDLLSAVLLETPECMSGETTLHTVPVACCRLS